MSIRILYEDKHLLVCCKPSGMPSQPDPSGQASVLAELARIYPTVRLIHRLDTPTGGVMVFGRSPQATARLSAMVSDHSIFVKEYIALLSASPSEESGTWQDYLYHDKQKNKSFVTDASRKSCKHASLDYRVLGSTSDGHTLVLVRLHTGRTHQIRVQFASRGFPLVGDGKYGSREKCPGIALWAYRLTFPHPQTKQQISVSSPPDATTVPWVGVADLLNFSSFTFERR